MELTEQQKLEILCAYLPYGVECDVDGTIAKMHSVYYDGTCTFHDLIESEQGFQSVRPILRHPDDMTEEEKEVYDQLVFNCILNYSKHNIYQCLRYLHSLHIDTFGAIEAGWAIRKESK